MEPAVDCEVEESDEDKEEDRKEDDNPQDGEEARPGSKKSAEALERAERLQANLSKYEHLSDEELEMILPKTADGAVSSIGAMLHASEMCNACSFFHYSMKGCHSGTRCKYCHADHPKKEKKRNRKRKKPPSDGEETVQKPARTDHDRLGQHSHSSEGFLYDPAFPGVRLDQNGNSCPSWLKDEDVRPSFNYARPIFAHAGSYGPYGPLPHGAYGTGYCYGAYGGNAVSPPGYPYGAAPLQQAWGSPWGAAAALPPSTVRPV